MLLTRIKTFTITVLHSILQAVIMLLLCGAFLGWMVYNTIVGYYIMFTRDHEDWKF